MSMVRLSYSLPSIVMGGERSIYVFSDTIDTPFPSPRCNVHSVADVPALFSTLMELVLCLAAYGLIHCDFNEFNVLLDSKDRPTVIDFPQMVSTSHSNAKWYSY